MPARITRLPRTQRTKFGRACQYCGLQATPENPISKRRKCRACADLRVRAAVVALHRRSGPLYELYRERQRAGFAAHCARRRAARVAHPSEPPTAPDEAASSAPA